MTRMIVSAAVIIVLIATIEANLVDRGKFWGSNFWETFMWEHILHLYDYTLVLIFHLLKE